jgi:uncharacterized protein YndB with AHSA1/START domain
MGEQSFTTTFTVDRTPDEVFTAITDVRGWWSQRVDGSTDRVGGEFDFVVPGIHTARIRVTELVPAKTVVWRVLDNHFAFVTDQNEWIDTEVRFDIIAREGGSELRFTHTGLVADFECYDVCSGAWSFFVGDSLRALITQGAGQPLTPADEQRHRAEMGLALS